MVTAVEGEVVVVGEDTVVVLGVESRPLIYPWANGGEERDCQMRRRQGGIGVGEEDDGSGSDFYVTYVLVLCRLFSMRIMISMERRWSLEI